MVKKPADYRQVFEASPVFDRAYTGFMLFDPVSGDTLYKQHANRYFTPASNTKIFTLYTALQILGDSVPSLHYVIHGDSLIFWGTGDPSLRNPYLSEHFGVTDFLKTRTEKIFYYPNHFKEERFGAGWSWDDYYYAFQPEKSALPYHGNVVRIQKEPLEKNFTLFPSIFKDLTLSDTSLESRYFKRLPDKNQFAYHPSIINKAYDNDHPYITSPELTIRLLEEASGQEIRLIDQLPPHSQAIKTFYSVPVDTIYRPMMQASDNFMAEQLILLCSDQVFGTLNTEQLIEYAKDSLMQSFPDEPLWADGSGLSRYNLFTPRTIIHLLHQLYLQQPKERLFHIFAAGGISGTIENWYPGEEQAYVYAKTGTLSNNHCLSGYLVADSGRLLIFSFMHNNYKGGSTPFKKEMQKVLEAIKREF